MSVVLILIEVKQIARIMRSAKDDMLAECWVSRVRSDYSTSDKDLDASKSRSSENQGYVPRRVVTEGSQHLWKRLVSKKSKATTQSVSTFYLVVGTFFALSDVNNTKKRLVDGEALGECAEQMRMAKHPDRSELLRELIEADVNVHHNRPVAGVAVERGDMGADGMMQPGGGLGTTIIGGFLQQRILKLRCVSGAKSCNWRFVEPTYNNTVAINKHKNEGTVFLKKCQAVRLHTRLKLSSPARVARHVHAAAFAQPTFGSCDGHLARSYSHSLDSGDLLAKTYTAVAFPVFCQARVSRNPREQRTVKSASLA
jgi:hypothetical protein